RSGSRLDVGATERIIHSALGSLSRQTAQVPVKHLTPLVTDAFARRSQARVAAFLEHPPVVQIGRRVAVVPASALAPMIHFRDQVDQRRRRAAIVMTVNRNAVASYVASLAQQSNQPATDAVVSFSGGNVQVQTPQRKGRTLDQAVAVPRLLSAIEKLKPNARLHFPVTHTKPPIDLSNPASLGIRADLGAGESSFPGASDSRLSNVIAISKLLNDVLISPKQNVSFNTLVGTDWSSSAYNDGEQQRGGQVVPTDGGAVQQVATAFFRALYAAGLEVQERHAHPYLLPWYGNPVGLDAVVDPANGKDLRFYNNTGGYLLLETRVEPIRQELYIYVYGPKLGWRVTVSRVATVLSSTPHGRAVVTADPNLPAGTLRQVAWAHNGEKTVVERTITYRNGNVHTDRIYTVYQPWRAAFVEGPSEGRGNAHAHRQTHKLGVNGKHGVPTIVATPRPSPTPTFSH
ncbi:MAG: VanW family protein, partial [Chloroflexota bacterium]